jgi:integrase/recombinase XerD
VTFFNGASLHSGRRSFAKILLEQGVGVKNVEPLMGHLSIATTEIYAENNSVLLEKISESLSI